MLGFRGLRLAAVADIEPDMGPVQPDQSISCILGLLMQRTQESLVFRISPREYWSINSLNLGSAVITQETLVRESISIFIKLK